MSVTDTANDLRTRASGAAEAGRARAADLAARTEDLSVAARERAEEVRARTEDLSAAARERAERIADTAEPHVRDVAARASAATAAVPGIVERILDGLGRALGFLGEGGRLMAARVAPPASVRRRERVRTAGWFVGGMAVGAAAGWVAHARMHHEPQEPYAPPASQELPLRRAAAAESPYGDDAAAIDARRENAGLG